MGREGLGRALLGSFHLPFPGPGALRVSGSPGLPACALVTPWPFSPQELPEYDELGQQHHVTYQGWDLLSSQEAELIRQAPASRSV